MKLHEIMRLDRLARMMKSEPVEEIVKEIPQGFFLMRQSGRPDLQMYNGVIGLIGPVKSSFCCGSKLYQRERDARGELIPLKVCRKPAPNIGNSYGNFVRGDHRIVDAEVLFGFNGDFEYEPMK